MTDKDDMLRQTCGFHAEALTGSEKVQRILGYWPSFHDGILDSLHLDPSLSGTGVDIRTKIRVHRMLDEVDERGYYKLIDHMCLTFLFHNATLQSLSMDLFPDILMDFKLQKDEPQEGSDSSVEVRLVSTGVIDFFCDKAEVVDAFRIVDSSD